MSRRSLILGLGLLVLTIAAGGAAWRLWRQQQLSAVTLAGVAPGPDVTRWPVEFHRRLQIEEAAVRTGRQPTEALGRLALLYFVNGFPAEASQALSTLRQLEPKNARWPYLQADLRLRVADQPGAAAALREVTALDPAYVPAWIKLGDVLVEQTAYADAEHCYLQAVKAAPGDVRAGFALVSFEAFHGKRGDPRKELQQLVDAHPGIKPMHELLARMNDAAGDVAGATRQRQLAGASKRYMPLDDPWIDELYVNCFDPNRLSLLAGKMEREGRFAAAVARLNRAIELAPTEPALRNSLAEVRIRANQPEEAVAVLQQAIIDCPDDPALRERLAMLLRTGKRRMEAVEVARAAVARWPQNAAMHTALGQALRAAGIADQALQVLLTALQLDPSQAEAWYEAGYCLFIRIRHDEAKTYLAKALEIRPDYREALLLRAGMAIQEGDVVAAEAPIKQLMVQHGDDGDVRLLFAALHLIKGKMARDAGNPTEAARFFRLGLDVFPDFLPLLREAGLLAKSQGRSEEARRLFEQGVRAAEAQGNAAQAAEFRELVGR
jgi:tetratricopeptide (TPR) repeat protein